MSVVLKWSVLIMALAGGRHGHPSVTVEETGSERATIMFKTTQQARPCNAEAYCGEQSPDFRIAKVFEKCSKHVLAFVLQKAVPLPTSL